MFFNCGWCSSKVFDPIYYNRERTIHFCSAECSLKYEQRKRKEECHTTKK